MKAGDNRLEFTVNHVEAEVNRFEGKGNYFRAALDYLRDAHNHLGQWLSGIRFLSTGLKDLHDTALAHDAFAIRIDPCLLR